MAETIASVFNDAYIAEQFEKFRHDPASVEESWREFFRLAAAYGGGAPAPSSGANDQDFARKVVGVSRYLNSIRRYGYLAVQLDPLGSPPPGALELTPEHYGITEKDLELVTGESLGFPHLGTGRDVAERLKFRYTRNLAVEFVHCGTEEERQWFRALFTAEQLTRPLSTEEKRALLVRLSEVDGLERFLGRAFVGYKRFSIEGTDALVPMLDTAINESAEAGAQHIAISMSHRGRINVLARVMGKPVEHILGEFQGRHDHLEDVSTGDVKYHLGFENERVTSGGRTVQLSLVPNPSHLEIVNPVLQGYARAHQREPGAPAERNEMSVVPICIHGDAAFPGEGVVAETFNLARLRAYRVGGTLHVIVNNQVGFTTDPTDGRSTRFASDLAKGFEMPVIHVNGDDAEACVIAMRIAVAYRTKFGRDFLVDLVGYRRHGHNEGDEPTYTQPLLYEKIKAHPTPRQVWGARLLSEGVVTQADIDADEAAVAATLQADLDKSKADTSTHESDFQEPAVVPHAPVRELSTARLVELNEGLLHWPPSFTPHPRLAKQLERRRDAMGDAGGIDWGHAEALAFASILAEDMSIRFSGQDVERGTFSHRHAVLHDVMNGSEYVPLQHVAGSQAAFEIYNSALSEMAVMGFEYGYSCAAPDTLTLWEGQFGDFANVAQPIIDEFLSADRAKWAQDSGLVLLLPHGYEGQGPEHSSARLERFLQMCAEGNMRVAYPSTPAQYFHILRRQAATASRRPLILMQPKSLLRLAQAASWVTDLSEATFQPVIDDPTAGDKRESVSRLVLCTGKIYYELVAKPLPADVAVVRVEELYPWPHAEISRVLDLYPNVKDVAWVQEEPKNMGAWSYVAPRLRGSVGNALVIRYIGRPERASPAEGYPQTHTEEQARIVGDALATSGRASGARRGSGVMKAVWKTVLGLWFVVCGAAGTLGAQERGAAAVDQAVRGATVTSRVLMIAAHPDDEDTQLIAYLTRGRRVETAYLSLTRGDGGQNLIGNELGEALGAIRTEELLAARRLDGGHQYFARAFDFGFSKSAEETYKHWDHDSLLADVVTVIRSFRPHVIVSVWSGTPADGHGHHTVAGLLSREAYDAAADTVRFPEKLYGRAWAPLKFYRGARGNRTAGAVGMNVGEYDPVLGRSYGEIAGESRAQHRSQGFGGFQVRKGAQMDYVVRQGSRVNESTPPADEKTIFDGIDTTYARLARAAKNVAARTALTSAGAMLDSARALTDLRDPQGVVRWLARSAQLAQTARLETPRCVTRRMTIMSADEAIFPGMGPCDAAALDLDASLNTMVARTAEAALDAAGVTFEATASQELLAFGDSMPVTLNIYNRGDALITMMYARINDGMPLLFSPFSIAPDSSARLTRSVIGLVDSRPWWQSPHQGDLFPMHDSPSDGLARVSFVSAGSLTTVPGVAIAEDARRLTNIHVTVNILGAMITADVGSITFHSSDPLLGEQNRPVGGVPAVTLAFDRGLEWMVANKPLDHVMRVTIKSFASTPRTFSFKVVSPTGIRVDSIPVSMTLQAKEERELFVRVRGQLKPGRYEFGLIAETENGKYMDGFRSIEYGHIRPIRMYRSSAVYLQAVDITIPATLSVAYIQGVGDNTAPYLRQLGIPVTIISAEELPVIDLGRFSTVVVGTRAYEAHRELVAYNSRLMDFAKKGGTLIVQYGQDIATLGVMPFPVTTPRTSRVTEEQAPVTVLDPKSKVLNFPNKIGKEDWDGWVQERGLYMPTVIDPHYSTPLEMHDPGEPEIKGALLVAPLGKGTYIFTSLSLFRQIPGGVDGGARMFVNLLSAGQEPPKKVQP